MVGIGDFVGCGVLVGCCGLEVLIDLWCVFDGFCGDVGVDDCCLVCCG